MSKSYTTNPPAPVALSFDAIDELIYNARLGDIQALKDEISKSAAEHNVSASTIIRSAVDTEDESEGGTGACLLHWPAANGNFAPDAGLTSEDLASFLNYRNYTGNTPLHWAALNTHLDCVKALVEAGADISLKNDAGHDALFLAERADWSVVEEDDNKNENNKEEEIEIEIKEGQDDDEKPAPPPTKARAVVEWLLSCDKGAGFEEAVNKQEDTKMEDAQ
ncbi:ankyrin repeat protein [Talaromyces pinophilus]|uniref:Ankyrin repeat protein n=1 Tax=Talaromyces pinophilus TaxID=128442 RepID=A0A510NV82_TALPI|nr:ankyrin repeat protein [Talaromyces pinophilus]